MMDVLAGNVHETLVRVDCTGRVIPALARSWSSVADTWRFEIRRGATFADGTPATARSVAEALSPVPLLDGYTVQGEYDLAIMTDGRRDIQVFADPSVYLPSEPPGIPAGTGPYATVFEPRTRVVQLIARQLIARGDGRAQPVSAHAPDTISIRTFGTDLRQAIDAGVDALVTHDAATVAYARARTGYSVVPLTWSSTYVLATTRPATAGEAATAAVTGDVTAASMGDSVTVPPDAFPDAVVGAASRPARAPFWWERCSSPDAGDSVVTGRRARTTDSRDARILFLRDDPVARAIAERITALARGRAPEWLAGLLSGDAVPTAVGVDVEQLAAALESRRVLGVVTAMRRVEHGGCGAASTQSHRPLLAGWRITPLIDTRNDLIHRAGIGRVTVDANGTLRFGGS